MSSSAPFTSHNFNFTNLNVLIVLPCHLKIIFPVIIVYYEMLFNILYIWPNPKCRLKGTYYAKSTFNRVLTEMCV